MSKDDNEIVEYEAAILGDLGTATPEIVAAAMNDANRQGYTWLLRLAAPAGRRCRVTVMLAFSCPDDDGLCCFVSGVGSRNKEGEVEITRLDEWRGCVDASFYNTDCLYAPSDHRITAKRHLVIEFQAVGDVDQVLHFHLYREIRVVGPSAYTMVWGQRGT